MKTKFCLFILSSLNASAAITYILPGASEQSTWILNNTNYPTATYRSFGTAAQPWGAAALPTSGTSSATLEKVSGSGYMSSAGFMYTAGQIGNFRISDTSPLASMETLIFQGGISAPFDRAPIFNYNGGTQAIAAQYFLLSPGTPYPDRVWQWDLTGIMDPLTSYEILFSGHVAATSLTIDVSNSYLQIIPEPSTGLLGISALVLTLICRRRV